MHPELSGDGGRARLVVLAAEVGRRWSNETAGFLCALAKARAETMPLLMLKLLDSDVEVPCWRAVQQGRSPCLSSNSDLRWGAVPSVQEVLRDDRFAGAGSVFTFLFEKKKKKF